MQPRWSGASLKVRVNQPDFEASGWEKEPLDTAEHMRPGQGCCCDTH